ncbi:extracellular catalytic domain type 1 short-chain-length polyhydroxyalkanoate depolymerase [Longitalea luteola]|uniref:extracellular catalytic domain type 1 short-chain-length polyhydroxyalkanoate depolymerase n=1 Tax=Longitalea luteola TaxID=2812563 RepID=UPI001A9646D4|nr:PHB depolymerase family esterase [Longitalea luteola]
MKQNIKYVLMTLLTFPVWGCKKTDDPPLTIFHFYDTLRTDGYTRRYLVNLPPDYNNNQHFPLVIALHGTGGSALQMEHDYGLTAKSNKAGFIVVYPEGVRGDGRLGIRTWNAGRCCDYAMEQQVDDVLFIRQLIEKLTGDLKINPKRIYATGMSNGAMLTYRLGCELSHQLAAIAPVSGTLMTTEPCAPVRQVPVLHIHSALDDKVPFNGGYGLANYYFTPVDSALRVWAGINGCDADPQQITEASLYTRWQYNGCMNGAMVQWYITKDGGHSWPGGLAARPAADPPSAAFSAADLIWDFFQQHELP